jgi:hypothetical protein
MARIPRHRLPRLLGEGRIPTAKKRKRDEHREKTGLACESPTPLRLVIARCPGPAAPEKLPS